MDLEWLRDTIVELRKWDHGFWAMAEGINTGDWSRDTKRFLHLVSRRIRSSRNRTNINFPQDLVETCDIHNIQLNVGEYVTEVTKMNSSFPVLSLPYEMATSTLVHF